MAKDARSLREEAAAATAAGKFKRALSAYLELERLEPRDPQWAKRAGETYRRLNNTRMAIEAYSRSAERYAQGGFLVQAIAVCKLILQIDPQHADTLRRISQMNEEIGRGPTRAASVAENNPALHENTAVNAIRMRNSTGSIAPPASSSGVAQGTETEIPRYDNPPLPPKLPSSLPLMARTKSKPISMPPGVPLESITLAKEVPESFQRDHTSPGIHVIPIDEEPSGAFTPIEVEQGSAVVYPQVDESTELDLADLEEISRTTIGTLQAKALAATPLFAGLPHEALEALVQNLTLVPLSEGDTLFREGDAGDALYVIAEGEVAVQAEGPPRVEMARLGPGAFLGEVALMTDQPRSATVTAVSTAELLRIDRLTLSRVLANHGDVLRAVLRFVRDRLVDRWMRTSPLFRPFADAERVQLAGRFRFLEIEAGTLLLTANSRPDGLYIVLAGKYDVKHGANTLATLGPGDLIGETALLSGGIFRSDVISHGKGLALCLPADDFREVIMTHPHVLEYLGEKAEHSRRLKIL
ncbi:MAG: cyclic nucleotide-binding domain-containing protein [Kofleriaceae bacterium]